MGRMKFRFRPAALAAALLAGALPIGVTYAHHSFAAEFDRSKPIEVEGTVTKVEWMNPHARFYVEEANEDGTKIEWNFELTSPNVLTRRGWSRKSLQPGDKVAVKGYRAKHAVHVGSAASVTLANGRKLFSGNADEDDTGQ